MRRDLVPEAAADVLRDDAQLVEADPHRRPHHDRREAGELVVRVHRPLARPAVVLDERGVALERCRVEAVEVELADRDDVVRLGERRIDVAPLPDTRVREVAAAFLVEHCRAVRQGRTGIDDDVERLVVDDHELGCVTGQLASLGDDGDDGLPEVAHLADRERIVLDVPPGRRRDLEERVGQDRHLVARERSVDARQLESPRDVDRHDRGVRVRGADEVEIAHGVALDVVDEDSLTLKEPPVFLAGHALTHGGALLQRAGLGLGRGHRSTRPAGGDDRFDDVPVAGAAADVPLQSHLHLVLARLRVLLQQRGRAHQHPGRAVAALEPVVLVERPLQRRQRSVFARQALHGRDRGAVCLHGEQAAALHRVGRRAARCTRRSFPCRSRHGSR